MNIKYLYIYKYKNEIKNMNLNFGSKYKYEFVEDKWIEYKKVNDYFDNFYSEYSYLDNLTAIIGKNASGKTTIMRIINDIFSEDSSQVEYIILFTMKEKLYLVYNFKDKRKIQFRNNDLNINNIILLKNQVLQDVINTHVKIIYYSGIFDKASPLNKNDYLTDISTNRLVRDIQVSDSYSTKEVLNEWSFDYDNNIDLVDKFELDEIERKVKYYIKTKDNSFSEKYQLFEFPKNLTVMFTINEGFIDKISKSKEKSTSYNMLSKALINYINIVKEYQSYMEYTDEKENLKCEFLIFVIIEILYISLTEFNINLDTIILSCNDYIEKIKKNPYTYDVDKVIIGILDNIYRIYAKKEKYSVRVKKDLGKDFEYICNNLEECLAELQNTDDEDIFIWLNDTDIEELEQENIDEIKNIIEQIKLAFEYIECNIEKLISIISIDGIENFIGMKEEVLEHCYIIDDLLKNNDTYVKEDTITKFLDYKKHVEDNISNLLQLIKKMITEGNYDDSYSNNKLDIKDPQIDFMEFFSQNKLLVNYFLNFIDNNDVNFDENKKTYLIRSEWTNTIAIDFIKTYYKTELECYILKFTHEELSSGQKAYLDMFSRLTDLSNLITVSDAETIILLDEGELYLHPEIQIKFVYSLLELLNTFFKSNKIHLILASNSPFIISDIPNTNIIYLGNNNDSTKKYEDLKTLGANINVLLENSFFMNEGTIGNYALKKINIVLSKLLELQKKNEKLSYNESQKIKSFINLIGEPLIKYKLDSILENLQSKGNTIDEKINFYKEEIRRLENEKKNLN